MVTALCIAASVPPAAAYLYLDYIGLLQNELALLQQRQQPGTSIR